ncbi:MAG: sel1 repeat family protein, partial [Methylobacteriaceae bacterium]|nr:sel1 repeat family protein [Methylobacteriaceae bacterium]
AAEQGDADAQNNLGVLYLNGLGVARNDADAVMWFGMAAEQGLPEAKRNLDAIPRSELSAHGV